MNSTSLYFSEFFSASDEMLSGEGKRHGKLTYRYPWLLIDIHDYIKLVCERKRNEFYVRMKFTQISYF